MPEVLLGKASWFVFVSSSCFDVIPSFCRRMLTTITILSSYSLMVMIVFIINLNLIKETEIK